MKINVDFSFSMVYNDFVITRKGEKMIKRYFVDKENNHFLYDGSSWKQAKLSYVKEELVWKFKIMNGWTGRGRPEDKPFLTEISVVDTIQNVRVIG